MAPGSGVASFFAKWRRRGFPRLKRRRHSQSEGAGTGSEPGSPASLAAASQPPHASSAASTPTAGSGFAAAFRRAASAVTKSGSHSSSQPPPQQAAQPEGGRSTPAAGQEPSSPARDAPSAGGSTRAVHPSGLQVLAGGAPRSHRSTRQQPGAPHGDPEPGPGPGLDAGQGPKRMPFSASRGPSGSGSGSSAHQSLASRLTHDGTPPREAAGWATAAAAAAVELTRHSAGCGGLSLSQDGGPSSAIGSYNSSHDTKTGQLRYQSVRSRASGSGDGHGPGNSSRTSLTGLQAAKESYRGEVAEFGPFGPRSAPLASEPTGGSTSRTTSLSLVPGPGSGGRVGPPTRSTSGEALRGVASTAGGRLVLAGTRFASPHVSTAVSASGGTPEDERTPQSGGHQGVPSSAGRRYGSGSQPHLSHQRPISSTSVISASSSKPLHRHSRPPSHQSHAPASSQGSQGYSARHRHPAHFAHHTVHHAHHAGHHPHPAHSRPGSSRLLSRSIAGAEAPPAHRHASMPTLLARGGASTVLANNQLRRAMLAKYQSYYDDHTADGQEDSSGEEDGGGAASAGDGAGRAAGEGEGETGQEQELDERSTAARAAATLLASASSAAAAGRSRSRSAHPQQPRGALLATVSRRRTQPTSTHPYDLYDIASDSNASGGDVLGSTADGQTMAMAVATAAAAAAAAGAGASSDEGEEEDAMGSASGLTRHKSSSSAALCGGGTRAGGGGGSGLAAFALARGLPTNQSFTGANGGGADVLGGGGNAGGGGGGGGGARAGSSMANAALHRRALRAAVACRWRAALQDAQRVVSQPGTPLAQSPRGGTPLDRSRRGSEAGSSGQASEPASPPRTPTVTGELPATSSAAATASIPEPQGPGSGPLIRPGKLSRVSSARNMLPRASLPLPLAATGSVDGPGSGPHNGLSAGVGGSALGGFSRCPSIARPATTLGTIVSPSVSGAAPGNAPPVLTTTASAAFSRLQLMKEPFAPGAPFPFGQALNASVAGEPALAPAPGLLLRSSSQRVGVPSGGLALRRSFAPSAGSDAPSLASPGGPASLLVSAAPSPMPNRRSSMTSAAPSPMHAGRAGGASAAPSPLPTARLNVWSRRASWHSTGSHAPGVPLVLEHEEGCCDPDVQAADSPPHTPRASSNGAAAAEAAAAIAAAAAAAVAAANTEGVHSSPSDEAGDFFCKSLSVAPDTRPGSGSIGHTVSSAGASGSAVTLVSPPPSSAGQSANSARALGVGAWAVAAAAVAMPAVFGAFLAPEVAAGLLALLAAAVLAAEAAAIARPASGRRSSSGWLARLAAARGSFGASLAAGVLVAPALSKPTQLVAAMPAWASGLALLTVTVLACVAATALLGAWAMQGRQRGLRMVTVVSAPGQARASGSVAASSQLSSSAVVVTAAPSATDAAASDASAELAWLARQHTLLSAVKMRMIAEDDVAGIVRTLAAYVAELYDGFGAFLLMTLPPGEGDDLMDLEGSNGEGTNPGGEGGHHGGGMSGSGAKPPPLAVLVPLAHCPDLKPWMRRAISEEDSGRAKEGDGEDQHQGHEDDDDDGFVALGDLPTLLACLDEHAAACFADLNPPPPAPDFAPAAAAAEARLDPGFTPTATADFSHRAAAAAGGGSAGAGAGGSGSPDNDGPSSAEAYATPPAGTPRPFSSSGMGRSSPPSPVPRPGSPWAPPPDMVVLGDHLSASGFLVAPIQCLEHSFGLLLVARPKARRVVSGGPGASGSAGSSPESNSGGGAGAGSSSQGGQRAAQGVSHHEEEPPPLDESLFELSCCLADELAAVLYMKHLEAEMAVSELLMADIMPHDAIQLLKRRHLKNLAVGAGSGSFTVGPVNTGGPASPTANARNSTGGPASGPGRHRRRGSAQPPSLANAQPPPLPPAPTPRHGLTPSPSMASIMGPPCLTPSVSISTHTNSFTTSLAGGASMYGGGYTSGITVGGSQRGGAASFSHPTSGIALGSVSSLSFGSSTGPSFTRSPSVPAWQQQQPLSPPLPPLHEGMPTSNEDSGPNPFTQAGPNTAAAVAIGPGSAGPSSAVERMGSGLTSRASEGARVLRRQGSSFGVSSLPLSRVNSIPRSPSGSATGGAEDSSINGGSNGGGALSASSAGAVANRAAAATAAAAASAAAVAAAAAVNATVNAASTVSASAVAASTAATAGSATGLSSSAEHAERTLGPDRTSALSGRTGTMPSDCGAEPYTEDLDRFWGNRSSAPERALPSDLSSRPSNMTMTTYTNVPYMAGGSTNGSPRQLTPRNSVPAMVSASVSTNAGGFSPPLLTMPRTQSASGWRAPAVRALVSRRPPAATRASHSGVTGTTAGAAFGTAAAVQHNSSSVHVGPVGMYRTSSDAMHEAEREAASAGGTGAGAEVERPMSGGRLPGAPYHMGGLRPSSVRAPLPGLDEMRSFGRGENVITAADFELDGVPLPSMGAGGSQAGEAEAAGAEGEADGAGGRRGSNEGERQLTPRAGPRSAGGGGAEGGGGGGGWHSSGSRDGTPPPAARRHARRSLHIPGNSSSGSGGLLVSGSGVILHAPMLYRDASAAAAATPMPPLATRTSERLQAHFPSLLRRSVTDMAYSMLPSAGLNGLAGLGAGTSSEGLPPTPTWAARHLSWRPTQHPAAAMAASSPFGTLVPGQPLDSPRITGSGGAAGAAGGAAALGGGAGSDTQGSWGTQSAPGPGSASGLAAPSPTATPTMTPPVDVPYKQWHTRVSVLFADIVGYTNMARSLEPEQVMEVLHSLFSRYDDMLGPLGVYKVETIGDAYMAATGLLHQTPDHAANLVSFGLGMIRAAANVLNPVTGEPLRIRVGINSGPVMSGIVGACRARYALFGDTVNTASRMESTGCPGCIQITEDTYLELPEAGRVRWSCRGEIEVKGKGRLKTYLLDPAAPVLASAFSVSGSAAGGGGPSVAAAAAPEP